MPKTFRGEEPLLTSYRTQKTISNPPARARAHSVSLPSALLMRARAPARGLRTTNSVLVSV